jgi:hypothetical protein
MQSSRVGPVGALPRAAPTRHRREPDAGRAACEPAASAPRRDLFDRDVAGSRTRSRASGEIFVAPRII